jgi:hypothetical protein
MFFEKEERYKKIKFLYSKSKILMFYCIVLVLEDLKDADVFCPIKK